MKSKHIVGGILVFVLVLTVIAVLYGPVWSTTPICEIVGHPEYDGKRVKVSGTVTDKRITLPAIGSCYTLESDACEIPIRATIAPAEGAKVTVQGVVKVLMQSPLGDLMYIDTTQ